MKMSRLISCYSVGLILAIYATPFSTSAAQDLDAWIQSHLEPLSKLYIHFHRHPELSFQEEQTADRIGKLLEESGAIVTYDFGGFGVVGIIENGVGPTVLLRTDLDGLPVQEQTNLPYASTTRATDELGREVGVMHACGHDMHMTCLIGAVQFLAEHRQLWSGRLMVIGQPAEERGAGATAMIKAGLFEKFGKPDFALALHCHAALATGSISMRAGFAMANVDSVDIEVYGRGGHGAYPHTTIDPIVLAAKLILDIQTIVSREMNPIHPAVITVGSIHGGTKHNIIADQCQLQLTVRSYGDEDRKQLIDAIKRKARAAAISVDAKEPLVTVSEGTPSLSNDPKLSNRIFNVFKQKFGDAKVSEAELSMGGEDFSHFGRSGIPSLMFSLGVVDQNRLDRYQQLGTQPPSLHSPLFHPDIEDSLSTGVRALATASLDLLPRQTEQD